MADFCFFKQKTAYEMRISDWSSDVCSSDLDRRDHCLHRRQPDGQLAGEMLDQDADEPLIGTEDRAVQHDRAVLLAVLGDIRCIEPFGQHAIRSEEHTSELQSLMRISYAVFCLKKKKQHDKQKTKC